MAGKGAKHKKIYIIAFFAVIAAGIVALGVGSVSIKPVKIINIVLQRLPGLASLVSADLDPAEEAIIWQIRMPRIVLSLLVGAELSVAGVIYQGIFRNPMADPYVIGASSGASLGASVAILIFSGVKVLGIGTIPLFAFIGAMGTIFLVYAVANIGSRADSSTLLLSGIAVSSFLSALVSFFMYFSGSKLQNIYFWLMGSLAARGWNDVILNLPYGVAGIVIGAFNLRALNILQLGENTAFFTGVDTELTKKICLISASLLTASAVSVSGVVGFVGLIIPHITRIIVGPDHNKLYPISALIGGLYLMLADTLSRVIIQPTELPVGILTSLLGGPFFMYLLLKRKKDTARM